MKEKIQNYQVIQVEHLLASLNSEDILHINDKFIRKPGKNAIYYYNGGTCFDCETSNTYINDEKIAFMYIWQFCINDKVIIGRTWPQYVKFIDKLTKDYDLGEKKRIIFYIHNASFDFQFLRKWFEFDKVFALDKYEPLYAISGGIEYRCSYLLSGMSLSKLAVSLKHHKIQKLKGDLNYDLIRHSTTYITDEEMQYCIHDVLIGQYYIDEEIESYTYIWKIPLTKTGKVRQYCRENCIYIFGKTGKKYLNKKYHSLMQSLTLEVDEYNLLKDAFAGGFTHSDAFRANQVHYNVTSKDFTSSYPAVMMASYFPMSKGKRVVITSRKQLEDLCRNKCVVFQMKCAHLKPKDNVYDNPLSYSKSVITGEYLLNNGRVVSADEVVTVVTELDFDVLKAFYDFDSLSVGLCYVYERGRLPRELLNCVLKLYQDKTTLKGVKGSEDDYLLSKELLNSTYGMIVTAIVRDEIIYIEDWDTDEADKEAMIDKYNSSYNRFLFYPWGVYVTAHARHNLFTAIYSIGKDFLYSDTDSIKYLNEEAHVKYFDAYNKHIDKMMNEAMKYLGKDKNAWKPKTIKGVEKPLGFWDDDGEYTRFKTLGAKRYLVEEKDGIHLTLAGLPKTAGENVLASGWSYSISKDKDGNHKEYNSPFNAFRVGLTVDKEKTNKMTHTYIDDEIKGDIIDYRGVKGEYHEKSYIHLEKAGFEMSDKADFLEFVKLIQGEKILKGGY